MGAERGDRAEPAGGVLGHDRAARRAAAADLHALRRPGRDLAGVVRALRRRRRRVVDARAQAARAGGRARGRPLPVQRHAAGRARTRCRSPGRASAETALVRSHLHLLSVLQLTWGGIMLMLGRLDGLLALGAAAVGWTSPGTEVSAAVTVVAPSRSSPPRCSPAASANSWAGRALQRHRAARPDGRRSGWPCRTCSSCRSARRSASTRSGCCCTTRRARFFEAS